MRSLAGPLAAAVTLLASSGALAQSDLALGYFATPPAAAIAAEGDSAAWRFSHPAPPASVVPPVWQAAFDWMAEHSGGRFTIEQFGAGSLHGPAEGFRAVRGGISEYAACYTSFEPTGFEMTRVFELPFVVPERPLVSVRVAMELARDYYRQEFEAAGVSFAHQILAGLSNIMSATPIRTLDDLQGLRVSAQGFQPEVAEALGFNLVNIPYPELYAAFQQGIIDAVLWVDAGFVPYRIYELAPYYTTLNITTVHIDSCFSPDAFAALPPDLQAAFYEMQQRIAAAITDESTNAFAERAQAAYAEAGVEFIELPEEELQRMRDAVQPVIDDWVARLEAEGKPASQLLADIERLEAHYSQFSDEELRAMILAEPIAGIVDF